MCMVLTDELVHLLWVQIASLVFTFMHWFFDLLLEKGHPVTWAEKHRG